MMKETNVNPFRRACTMLRRHLPCLLLVAVFPPLLSADAGKDLAGQIETVINAPDYKEATWGILIVDSKTGKTVYGHNPDKLFKPASVTKLYSTAAALDLMGANYKFQTPVYARGKLSDGKLKGDLILVAQGDPTLGGRNDSAGHMLFTDHDHIYAGLGLGKTELTKSDPLAGLKDLARQVAGAGIRHVTGDVLIDDRLFVHGRGTGSGPDRLTPIVVNDNLIDVIVTPGAKVGEPARVRVHPENHFVLMDAQVDTGKEHGKVQLQLQPAGRQRFTVRGRVPVKSRTHIGIYIVEDPAAWARGLFIETLRGAGVKIDASALRPPQAELPARDGYERLKRVALYTSPPFSEVVKVTLKVSHNLYASMFPLLIAVRNGQNTLAEGLRLQGKFLSDLGVDAARISFGGGAGGDPADAVTPRATVQLLSAMARRSDYKYYKAGLPVLGVDGTLADAVKSDSPARGKLLAKTGTYFVHDVMNGRSLLTSKSLAGVMTTAKGRSLTLAVFVNRVPLPKKVPPTREGKVIGRLCEIIYRSAP
jgi:D-alanyl-D-alanine carboxypeptidase/D-alanyl-D-alanine-endopeptidase (penicillin-binding protein 4)